MRTASRRARVRAALLLAGLGAAAHAPAERALSFRIDEGRNINSFVREGPVAAHLLLRSGLQPRLLVAFPAGNSGVGLWFARRDAPVEWRLDGEPRPVTARDARGRALRGIEFTATVRASSLAIDGAVLSSVRVLRDRELTGQAPREVLVTPEVRGRVLLWQRDRLDGAPGYLLSLEAGQEADVTARGFAIGAGDLRLRVRALTGETPLQPLAPLLTAGAAPDPRARDVLAFLSYREKFLAGSWRFDTYFGRDTLVSALLLAPVLEPEAMESAIASVLDRLAPDGEVAHEEDIGEFAVLRNVKEGRERGDAPIYDYGMVDDDFLLAPLAARWLLDDARARPRTLDFLHARTASGAKRGELLARNLVWLTQRAAAFAEAPSAANLVAIHEGRETGNWRDSEQGLAHGRYPYDVNAALVPAALDATARLHERGLLAGFLDDAAREVLSRARSRAQVWSARAPALFRVEIAAAPARDAIDRYAREIGLDSREALTLLGNAPLAFAALSLDRQGAPIPILHTDEGFRWLLCDPPAVELAAGVAALLRPFPAGLLTDAGVLVANPAQAAPSLQRQFGRSQYHGTVVWSWQQALLAAGLARQLARRDLPEAVRAQLRTARADLWAAIDRTRALRTSELWSWTLVNGRITAEPFGRGGDADESNAAQLWSTVFLGLQRPAGQRPTSDTSPGN